MWVVGTAGRKGDDDGPASPQGCFFFFQERETARQVEIKTLSFLGRFLETKNYFFFKRNFTLNQVKSSYYSPNFIETEPANITTPRSSWAAARSL